MSTSPLPARVSRDPTQKPGVDFRKHGRRSKAIVLTVLLLGRGAAAEAQTPPDAVTELRRQLAAQEEKLASQDAIIRELLAWKQRSEREAAVGSAATRSPGANVGNVGVPDSGRAGRTVGNSGEPPLVELRERIESVDQKISNAPSLSGYYDFEYFASTQRGNHPGFDQHHLSLHVTKDFASVRSFAEVEFEHGTKFVGKKGVVETARGDIKVEQAWAEYGHSDALTLRGGLILLPNFWNVNHYPNIVHSTRRPLIVRKVFPESLNGVMLYGSRHWGETGVSYGAHVGNGEGTDFGGSDDNDAKAAGGKVVFHLPRGGQVDLLDVGVHFYRDVPAAGPDTRTVGFEAQMRAGRFELLLEYASRRALQMREGSYVQPSWRISDRWSVFARHDWFRVKGGDDTREGTVGLVFRPVPAVSLKFEVYRSEHTRGQDYNGLAASAAVAF